MSYTKSARINAPIEDVWKAWASSASTSKWLTPKANVDFRPGGAFEFFWGDDPAKDSTFGCVLLQIEPEKLLRFEQQDNGTLVTAEQAETRNHDDWAAYEDWMSKAWEMALVSLKEYCE